MDYDILISGNFSHDDLKITYQNNKLDFPVQVYNFIEDSWKKITTQHPNVFNGSLFRVSGYSFDKTVRLELEDTNYKEYAATRNEEFRNRFGTKYIANPLCVAAMVVTSDNMVVFGRRVNTEIESNKITVVSGLVDHGDIEGGSPNVFGSIRREMFEEIGVKQDETTDISSMGLVFNKKYCFTYIPFLISISEPSNKISIDKTEKEFSELFFVINTKEAIAEFMKEHERELSDVFIPTVEIYLNLI